MRLNQNKHPPTEHSSWDPWAWILDDKHVTLPLSNTSHYTIIQFSVRSEMSTSSFIKRAGKNLRKQSHGFFGRSRCIKSSERSSAQNLPSIQMVPDGESVNSRKESWQNSIEFLPNPSKISSMVQLDSSWTHLKEQVSPLWFLGITTSPHNIRVNSTQGWFGTSCPDTFFIDPRVGELELNRN